MHPARDFDSAQAPPPGADALAEDLELGTLLTAMAAGDSFLHGIARQALLTGLTDPGEIVYRQRILADCRQNPDTVRHIYDIAVQVIAAEKRLWWGVGSRYPSAVLQRAVEVMAVFTAALKKLRAIADTQAPRFESDGFTRFFAMIAKELDDGYFAAVAEHLGRLKFRDGVVVSATLGPGNTGTGYVLRQPRPSRRRLPGPFGSGGQATGSLTVSDKDEAGARALSELSDRGVNHVASALAQSGDHILGFFRLLRAELGFYVGCLNAHDRLTGLGQQVCFPVPLPPQDRALSAAGLSDPCLALALSGPVTGNDVDADGTTLVMVTGANQGGKSTFLRSLGLALLMTQAGMFAAAASLRVSVAQGVRPARPSMILAGKGDRCRGYRCWLRHVCPAIVAAGGPADGCHSGLGSLGGHCEDCGYWCRPGRAVFCAADEAAGFRA